MNMLSLESAYGTAMMDETPDVAPSVNYAPRGPTMPHHGRGQDMGQRGPDMGQRGPEMGQRGPEMGQRGPEMGQRGLDMGQRGPEMGHRDPRAGMRMGGPEMAGYPERPRRHVRFVNDGADVHKYTRVETNELPNLSWLEKNKVLVAAVAVTALVMLIIVLVIVLRCKRPTPMVAPPVPFAGGGIPTYVGGHGWESASNYGYGIQT